MTALENVESLNKKADKAQDRVFAKKPTDGKSKLLCECLIDLFRDIGISKFDENNQAFPIHYSSHTGPSNTINSGVPPAALANTGTSMNSTGPLGDTMKGNPGLADTTSSIIGAITQPVGVRPEDMYTASMSHTRQAMSLRIDHLFEELNHKLMERLQRNAAPTASANQTSVDLTATLTAGSTTADLLQNTSPESQARTEEILQILLTGPKEEILDTKAKLPTKPVVICDALPIPLNCPETIDQLLEASLAHHNLGSFDEALKFIEASRIQLQDIIGSELKKGQESEKNINNKYFDLKMYITMCKGNVYQSCGDDEQSLIQYMDGYTRATLQKDYDWEIICLNSIGVLAFFNIRYDISLLCFHLVYEYREKVSPVDLILSAIDDKHPFFPLYHSIGLWSRQPGHSDCSEQPCLLSILHESSW
jgi:hypothetical protein